MDIQFGDEDLRELCEQQRCAKRKLGNPCARKLHSRLGDLQAASHVKELIAGRPHPLTGDRAGQFALDLHGGTRLVFEPANDPVPKTFDDAIDWSQVTRVRIVYIGDYHD